MIENNLESPNTSQNVYVYFIPNVRYVGRRPAPLTTTPKQYRTILTKEIDREIFGNHKVSIVPYDKDLLGYQ